MAAIASRYARALVDVVLTDKIDPDKATQHLKDFVGAVDESLDLRRVWDSPAVTADQKRKVLDAIASQIGALKPVRNFMAILIDHRRISMLPQIARQFELELDAQRGIVEAEIKSARELGSEEKRDLESRIASLTGKKVRARYATDGDLLGGVVIRIGSTIYDGSVRGQLTKMKEQLSTA